MGAILAQPAVSETTKVNRGPTPAVTAPLPSADTLVGPAPQPLE